jgi:hypothetical protein
MPMFDAETLRALRDLKEVESRTEKHPKTSVTIWIVVSDGYSAAAIPGPALVE